MSERRAPSLSLALEKRGPFAPDGVSREDARAAWLAFRHEHGYVGYAPILTPPEKQRKLGKDRRLPLYSLSLAPASQSGEWNVCQWSTPKCRNACVLTARYASVAEARVVRTVFLAEHPAEAVALIASELREAVAERGRIGFRPNAGSDLRWERIAPALLTLKGVSSYDYTKAPASQRNGSVYRLVYSVSELGRSEQEALDYLRSGGTAAVVFDTKKSKDLPATWHGFRVLDGDKSDNRLLEPAGTVVGLRAKELALRHDRDSSGFVKEGVAT